MLIWNRRSTPIGSRWTIAGIGLAVTLLIPHTPLLLGHAAPMWDGIDLFAPYYMLVGDFARNGAFLLWNPFTLGGSPDYLEPQLGSFSPPVVAFGLLFGGTPLAFALYWLAIWLLGGAGMLVLARHLGTPPWVGFVGAVAFCFSGFYTGNAEHTALLYSISLLPWIVWRVDVAMSTRSLRPAVQAGALLGLSGLGGYPALVFLNGCFAVLWSVGRVVCPDEEPRVQAAHQFNQFKRLAAIHIVVALVGAAVMSPTYVPLFVEGPDVSDRAGPMKRDDAVFNNALHPAAVVTLSSPSLSLADLYEYTDISMRSVYVGVLIPAFAAFALVKRRGTGFRWWLLAVALLFLGCAFGRALPLRGWLYDWVPPTRYFRQAALFRCYTIFALTVLGMFGMRDLTLTIDQNRKMWRRFAITVVCVAAAALATYTNVMVALRGSTSLPPGASNWHAYGLWISLCVVALAGLRVNRSRWREVAPVAFVVLATGDALSTSRLVRSTMYNPHPETWRSLDQLHRTTIDLTASALMRRVENRGNLTFLSKVPTIHGYSSLAGALVRRYSYDDVLADSATGPDRLWFSRSVGIVNRSEECFQLFLRRATKLAAPPIVVHPQAAASGASEVVGADTCEAVITSLPPAERLNSFKVLSYRPSQLTLQVDVPAAGWLLVTDTWSRSWHVTVNGRESRVVRGNFVYRAVQVQPGTSIVDFRYRAIGFPWLLLLSWGMLFTAAAWSSARRCSSCFSTSASDQSLAPQA